MDYTIAAGLKIDLAFTDDRTADLIYSYLVDNLTSQCFIVYYKFLVHPSLP
jgi:hypothetical protein